MIEDKKFDLKIPEHKDEAFWNQMKTRMIDDIRSNEHNIEISKHILTLAEQKLKEKAWKAK